ncbi:hypothetical protein O181_072382 [Austropuccinia psidii MF-1]|uniref:Uncharacterized protein n=1 Tax=Austropuccinia psidii MF-1 TaxID=1389203 RepID=A0A9Q3F9E9_9BASI|nr:hypothetical protein [Austropuccinia psidii MF-1]
MVSKLSKTQPPVAASPTPQKNQRNFFYTKFFRYCRGGTPASKETPKKETTSTKASSLGGKLLLPILKHTNQKPVKKAEGNARSNGLQSSKLCGPLKFTKQRVSSKNKQRSSNLTKQIALALGHHPTPEAEKTLPTEFNFIFERYYERAKAGAIFSYGKLGGKTPSPTPVKAEVNRCENTSTSNYGLRVREIPGNPTAPFYMEEDIIVGHPPTESPFDRNCPFCMEKYWHEN